MFFPDVAVVDREFTAWLEREIGHLSVSNQLVVKRVNAEIVATIITILHDEAGLDARPGIENDAPPKDTALEVVGQLQAGDRGPSRPAHLGQFRWRCDRCHNGIAHLRGHKNASALFYDPGAERAPPRPLPE